MSPPKSTTIHWVASLSSRSLACGLNSLRNTSSANRSAVEASSESSVEVSEAKTTMNTKAAPPAPSNCAVITGKTMFTWGTSSLLARANNPIDPVTIGIVIQPKPPNTNERNTTVRREANTRDHQMLL